MQVYVVNHKCPRWQFIYLYPMKCALIIFLVVYYLDAANNGSQPALLHYSEFYNSALDHVDLMQEYWRWQSPERPGQFSYCQYPFMLSIVAKRIILTKVSKMYSNYLQQRLLKYIGRYVVFYNNILNEKNQVILNPLVSLGCRTSDDIGCEEIPCCQSCSTSNPTNRHIFFEYQCSTKLSSSRFTQRSKFQLLYKLDFSARSFIWHFILYFY